MTDSATGAREFLDAFTDIEDTLTRQQKRRRAGERWAGFNELVRDSKALLGSQKEELYAFASLRNAIVHKRYRDGSPIADPREDTVRAIIAIRDKLKNPPRLREVLKKFQPPEIFELEDDVRDFLELVSGDGFSQAPVRTNGGFDLITTNAVARWFSFNLSENGGVIDSAPISEVLEYAEPGDRLESISHGTTVVEAIRLFSGQADMKNEPPTALLVRGMPNQPPQRLCSRADLSLLYAALQV